MSRSTIEDFELILKLGSGSFGTVWKVKRHVDECVYVIKTVRIIELTFEEQKGAINEVKILAALESPYVVRYLDSFIDADSLHIVMEYCNKGDLQSLIKKAKSKNVKSLRENVTWNIGLQVILGLCYLHDRKILHRDLKSANVFLTKSASSQRSFEVKIGDLGVAKLLETSTAFAQTIVGTPYYLSPELCSDKPYRDKSDCWALGVLLYECCTLQHPFEARNQCALILKIIQEPPTQLPRGLVSDELATLILWLLEKEPEKRPTIREILNERFVREKLEENRREHLLNGSGSAFDLPADMQYCPLTNRLAPCSELGLEEDLIDDSQEQQEMGDKSHSAAAPVAVPGVGVGVWKEQPQVFPRPLQGVVRPTGPAPAPAPARAEKDKERVRGRDKEVFSHTEGAMKGAAGTRGGTTYAASSSSGGNGVNSLDKVRGDRVRGPGTSRVPSSKARERYQVKPVQPPSASKPEENYSMNAEKLQRATSAKGSLDQCEDTIIRAIEVKGAYTKHEPPQSPPTTPDARLEYTNFMKLTAEEKASGIVYHGDCIGSEKEADDVRWSRGTEEEGEDEDYYEEDFHPFDDNEQEKEGEKDGDDGDLDRSDASRQQMLLNTMSGRNAVAAQSSAADINEESYVDPHAFSDALEQLILEARDRCIATLGDTLFFRIYKLCSDFMVEAEPPVGGTAGMAAKNSKLLKDLELALCSHLQGGVEVACDAVFGVKVLLALEDKFRSLHNP